MFNQLHVNKNNARSFKENCENIYMLQINVLRSMLRSRTYACI